MMPKIRVWINRGAKVRGIYNVPIGREHVLRAYFMTDGSIRVQHPFRDAGGKRFAIGFPGSGPISNEIRKIFSAPGPRFHWDGTPDEETSIAETRLLAL